MPSKNKILILIDQNEVHNAIQIAKRLQNNFDIIFITDLASSYDNNRSSQKLLRNNFPKANIIDLRSELIKLNTTKKFNNIDYNFLNKFERNYLNHNCIFQRYSSEQLIWFERYILSP